MLVVYGELRSEMCQVTYMCQTPHQPHMGISTRRHESYLSVPCSHLNY
jgi:hypothetical protein